MCSCPAQAILAGERYGHLTVLRELPSRPRPDGKRYRRWFLCRCDCGTEFQARLDKVRCGKTRSCGCLNPPRVYPPSVEELPEHKIWKGMKDRCYVQRTRGYERYGGRGINVCDRWRQSFKAFYEDMGPRPTPEHQLDRYPDNDGNYEPGNCRWATRAEQNRNRRGNVVLEFRGERMCMTDWAKRFGMRKGTLRDRLRCGMTVEEALTTPVRQWTQARG